jgi:hypothetical protein
VIISVNYSNKIKGENMLVYKKINEDRNEQYIHGETGQRRLFENNLNKMLYYTSIPMMGNTVRLFGAEYVNRKANFTIPLNTLWNTFREIITPEARNFIREYVAPENHPHVQDDWGYEKDDECDEKCLCETCELLKQEHSSNDADDECDGDCEHCEFGMEDEKLSTQEKYGDDWFSDMIQDVIFNGNATTVIWTDGCKTTVKTMDGDVFDPMAGFSVAVTETFFPSKTKFKEFVQKYIDKAARRKPSKRIRKQMEKDEKELKDG